MKAVARPIGVDVYQRNDFFDILWSNEKSLKSLKRCTSRICNKKLVNNDIRSHMELIQGIHDLIHDILWVNNPTRRSKV